VGGLRVAQELQGDLKLARKGKPGKDGKKLNEDS
jgi:hypothetical protein